MMCYFVGGEQVPWSVAQAEVAAGMGPEAAAWLECRRWSQETSLAGYGRVKVDSRTLQLKARL